MVPFFHLFPEIAPVETRSIIIPPGDILPAGTYGFTESFCDEKDCDCRRVLIVVFATHSNEKVWAGINYGWERKEFYEQWAPGTEYEPVLEPLSAQSEYADIFLSVFKRMVQEDTAYVERIKRHYAMFKQKIMTAAGEKKKGRHSRKANTRRRK